MGNTIFLKDNLAMIYPAPIKQVAAVNILRQIETAQQNWPKNLHWHPARLPALYFFVQ